MKQTRNENEGNGHVIFVACPSAIRWRSVNCLLKQNKIAKKCRTESIIKNILHWTTYKLNIVYLSGHHR